MRNLLWIFIPVLIAASFSCSQKPSMTQEEIDAMIAEKQALEARVAEYEDLENELAASKAELGALRAEIEAMAEASKGRFHVIVGAFKVPTNAANYSKTMISKGYEGKVVESPFGFQLVTYSSHESLSESLSVLSNVRKNVVESAWVFIAD